MLKWAAVSWQPHNYPIALSIDSSPSAAPPSQQENKGLDGPILKLTNMSKVVASFPCPAPMCCEGEELQTRQACFLQSMSYHRPGFQKHACARPVIAGCVPGLTSATTLPSLPSLFCILQALQQMIQQSVSSFICNLHSTNLTLQVCANAWTELAQRHGRQLWSPRIMANN